MFDVLILGPMTRDVIRIGDEPARSQAGGVPIYAGLALAVLGFRVGVVTRLAEHDRAALTAPLAAAGVEVRCGPSEATTVFENIYAEGAESPRRQRLAAIAEPIAAADLAGLSARIVLLGPLTRGDLTPDVVAAAREAGDIVALDGQGLTRQRVRGTIRAAKPSGQGHELSTAHILKGERRRSANLQRHRGCGRGSTSPRAPGARRRDRDSRRGWRGGAGRGRGSSHRRQAVPAHC